MTWLGECENSALSFYSLSKNIHWKTCQSLLVWKLFAQYGLESKL